MSILGEFGEDTYKPQASRITKNGPADCKTRPYSEPQGPKYIQSTGPGLRGGTNFGNAGSQGKGSLQAEGAGSPGIHGTNYADGYDNDD